MRSLSPDLLDHLTTGTTSLCYCWRVLRSDGVQLGFTDHDRNLVIDGTNYVPDSGFDASVMSSSADLAVDNSDVQGVLNHDIISERDILAGLYDNARIETWRVNWRKPEERLLLNTGLIGEITRGPHGFSAEVRGLSHKLDQTVGRLYQRQCDANVGDQRCTVNLDNETRKGFGEVVDVDGDSSIIVTGLEAFDDDWFTQGTLQWSFDESVANRGTTGFVKRFRAMGSDTTSRQTIAFWQPMVFQPQIGDQFTITAGCDRRFETCRDKFANAINFRGFHLMPGNDFIISYPLRTDTNNGGRR